MVSYFQIIKFVYVVQELRACFFSNVLRPESEDAAPVFAIRLFTKYMMQSPRFRYSANATALKLTLPWTLMSLPDCTVPNMPKYQGLRMRSPQGV